MLSREFLEIYNVGAAPARRGAKALPKGDDSLAQVLFWPSIACVAVICYAVLMASCA